MKETFAARLKKARGSMTQPELARRCGWGRSQSRISMYEGGKRWPSIDHIIKMADVLGVSAQFLIFGDETKQKRGQMTLDLTPSAITIATIYDQLPAVGQEYVAATIDNMMQLQGEHPDLAARIFTRPDQKKRKAHEKRMEQLQVLSRKKLQYERRGGDNDGAIHDGD